MNRNRIIAAAAAAIATVIAFSAACWLAVRDGAPQTPLATPRPGEAQRQQRRLLQPALSNVEVYRPRRGPTIPVPESRIQGPPSAVRAPESSKPYLPLVEPYESIPDLDPASPEGKLAARLAELVRAEKRSSKRRLLATLRVRLDYMATRGANWKLTDLARQLDEVLAGRDPFAAERGNSLRGYYAANDNSCQPYSLTLPPRYDPERKYPLVLELHCHGWGDWYRPFQGHPVGELDGAIMAAPHGRGSCDYLWIAEDDVLAVRDAVIADYPVDDLRVFVTGWSMGGTGSFHLPGRYPDRFNASTPKAGNADFTAWEQVWKEDRRRLETPLESARMFLRWKTAPVSYAENFLHVPIAIDHGAQDAINPVGHSRSMAGRLKQLGYRNVRFRAGSGGHGWGASLQERFKWMLQFRGEHTPRRVRLKTGDYRHGGAYWVEVTRLADRMKMADLDVKLHVGNATDRVEITKAENVEEFRLRLTNARVQVSHKGRNLSGSTAGTGSFLLRRHGDTFRFAKAGEGEGAKRLRKRMGLEGPICDAFRDPFLVVVGTTSKYAFERKLIRNEAERWRRQWKRRFQSWPPVRDDTGVTAADISAKNLMLFGGPHANSVTARVMPNLPARIEGKKITVGKREYSGRDLGLKLCYPNPLNPQRLVILQASTSWRGMWQMTHRFGNWFDWMPLDNREWFDFCVFDDKSAGFETFLDVGFFDEDWSLARANRWHGVAAWRNRAIARNYPQQESPADAETVRLSDLWPRQIDTAKGALAIDRGFRGKDLCIGRARQKHGLGQWIESAVAYDLEGRYRSLITSFGVDADGQTRISSARRSAERALFEIWGDGRLLASRRGVGFGDAPGKFAVDVTGVKGLTLRVLRTTPQGWLYGPVTWGEPTLSKRPLPARKK